jgi:hypothetical protein
MKGIKSFDFFQKISIDNVSQPTIIGSVLSISAISIMVFLLLREVADYFTPSLKKETIIYKDPNQRSAINVNMAITFYGVPCHIISVDQEDSIGHHRMDIHDTLEKYSLSKTDEKHPFPYHQVNRDVEVVEAALKNGDGCIVAGHVPISKVPGDIHISFHNYADVFMYLMIEKPDLFSKISLHHRFSEFNFGESNLSEDILSRFGFTDFNSFHHSADLPDYKNMLERKNYDYFVKLIPHVLVDNIRGETYTGYQFSMTYRTRDYNGDSREMPIIIMHYDLSPITMKITRASKSLAHSLTHICAIVGGVFVIFSLLNRLLLAFGDISQGDGKTNPLKN